MSHVLPDDAHIVGVIRALLADREVSASICPSEVARRLVAAGDWREAMPDVRRIACALAIAGELVITQSSTVLDPCMPLHGPVRLRRGPRWQASTRGAPCGPGQVPYRGAHDD